MNALNTSVVKDVRLEEIELGGINVRSDLSSPNSKIHLDELAESIRVNGLMQPIVLKGPEGKFPYDVVVGQRRFLAHKILGKESILATFTDDINEFDALTLSLSENLLRQELNHMDTMEAVTKLFIHYDKDEKALKEKLGLSIRTIRSYIKVDANATEKVKNLLVEKSITLLDAKRAIDAAQGDPDKIDKIVDELVSMTKHQKIRAVEYGKSNPSASVEDIKKYASTPKLEETIILNLPQKIKKALDKAVQDTSQDAEVIVMNALKDWLSVNDFLIEK